VETSKTIAPTNSVLKPLAGRWTMELRWSEETRKLVGGPASVRNPVSFEWIEDGCFLVHRMGGNGAPAARWVIGCDDTSGAFSALYADARGVCRIYEMTLLDGVWRIWRAAPGFHQRFIGRFSIDQRTIEARWEKSTDGHIWEHDFDLTYTKAGSADD
jgi:hypothetical protein